MLKYTNLEKTAAQFNGAFFSLAAPEDFTTIGDGPTREAVLTWRAEGNVPEELPPPPEPTIYDTLQTYENFLDTFLDTKAKELTFSGGRINLVARAGYPNPWQQLAIAYGTWMDQCNVIAWDLANKAIAGEIPVPTWEEVLVQFPVFVKPE